jgi:hypothetical protein
MATSLCTTLRNILMNALTTAAGSTAYLWIWTGSEPAKSSNNMVDPTGTNLALFALANPIAPGASVGVDTLSAISNVTGLASGTPGYYRVTAGTVFTLTQAAISGSTVTYTGTITGGGTNAFAGAAINVSGFTNAGNNGTFFVTASTGTTLVVTNSGGVNETHAGTVVMDSATNVQWQGSAGVSSGDIDFSSTIASSGQVGITSLTYTDGNA